MIAFEVLWNVEKFSSFKFSLISYIAILNILIFGHFISVH